MHSQHEKVEDLFSQALALPSGERTAFLEHACGQDAQLRERLTELLQATADAGQFLPDTPKAPPVEVGAGTTLEPSGSHVGRYKLLEKIGEGGCGVVYMAEQEEPVRRKVALKIIKAGMDSRQVIARFGAERQALAMMDHPNIAQFFDAGTIQTQSGEGRMQNPSADSPLHTLHSPLGSLPYFVMELVRGVRITDYCTQNNLPTRQRLDLFIQVCNAVQHAHQKGIIHRDLKPSNILVTENDGKPVPKVIDFGIAKATEGRLTDKTVFTQFAAFMGTPAYMSPEQAAMTSLDIDTRSDIYSLGVLLYELLTGTTPFDAQELLKAGFDEMRRVIRETEPEKPSTRLTQRLRRGPQSPLVTHHSSLATDLDWIVMKCLEKDRKRRYETASGLAEDIQRHLTNELVTARPPSATYRFRKMVRRNRVVIATMTAVGSALILGAMMSTWQALRATRAERDQVVLRQKAEIEATKSRQVAQFLKDMIGNMKPSVAMGRDTSLLREFADQTLESIGRALAAQPEVDIELRITLGKLYNTLGDYPKAEEIHRETLPRIRSLHDPNPGLLVDLLRDYADVLNAVRKPKVAESLAREALNISQQMRGEEHDDVTSTLRLIADSLKLQNKFNPAERLQLQALELSRKLHGSEHREVASQLLALASLYSYQGKAAQAEPLFRDALEMRTRLMPAAHPLVLEAIETFAGFHTAQKNRTAAAELFRRLLAAQREVLGNENRMVALTLGRLSSVLVEINPTEALPLVQEEVALRKRLHGEVDIEVAKALGDLGFVFGRLGRNLEETTAYQESLVIARKAIPRDFQALETLLQNQSLALEYQGRIAEAEAIDQERVEWARQNASADPERLENCLYGLADTLYRQHKYAEAEPVYREVVQHRRSRNHPSSEEVIKPTSSLARLLSDWAWQERTNSRIVPDPLGRARRLPIDLAQEAEALLRECLDLRLQAPKTDTNAYSFSLSGYSDKFLHSNGSRRLPTHVEPWSVADTRSRLGAAILSVAFTNPSLTPDRRMLRLAEAEKLLVDGHEVLHRSSSAETKHRRHALERLVRLYEAWNRPDKAATWRTQLEELDKVRGQQKLTFSTASPP